MIPVNPHYRPIYLDYMATTPVDPRVMAVMFRYLGPDGEYGNASNTGYQQGQRADEAIRRARQQVADLIQADEQSIIWTSGATEANNLALLGAARFHQAKGKHIITMSTEHKAVLEPLAQLEKEGFTLTILEPMKDGTLCLDTLKRAMRDDTVLVSIMHANNEIGVIHDLAAIANIVKSKGALFHVDAAQSVGKIPVDVRAIPIDLLSISGHKLYAPKGIGVLYVRQSPRVRLQPILFGGGQQNGLRPGTLPTAQIVAMGEACAISAACMESESQTLCAQRDAFWEIVQRVGGVHCNGSMTQRLPHNLNIRVEGVDGESLRFALSHLIAVSSRSACVMQSDALSTVLRALGLSPALANASVRVSFGRFTTQAEVIHAAEFFVAQVQRLRRLAGSLVEGDHARHQ